MIAQCDVCGEEDRLFEAITNDDIKYVCRRCLRMNNYPLIQKPTLVKNENFGDKTIKKEDRKISKETQEINNELKEIVSANIKEGK